MRRWIIGLTVATAALAVPTPARAQISDSDLALQIVATVRRDASLFTIFDDVSVAVNNRAVTLTGRVTMPYKRDQIAERVGKIDGVRSLTNRIQVLPVDRIDGELRQAIARNIYGNPSFWQYASMACPPIHIIVEHGRVTLTGVVNNQVERMLAFSLAQVDGVFDVKNQLRVDGQSQTSGPA